MRAYVLIEAEAGAGPSVLTDVRSLPECIQADRVTGPYDVICVLESNDLDRIGDLVNTTVHGIRGVRRTMSCLRFEIH
jgi:DNA-binding Lrp family transcriptional regulator